MSNGAVYIITQDARYVDLLLTSALSLKAAMPDLPITVFSQFPVESKLCDRVIRVDATEDGFYDKTRLMRESPYERTLFIDADTYVLEPVPELFTLLDRFDCAATHEEYLNTDWSGRYPRTDIPVSFPEFNTGILMLKHCATMDQVLQDWGALYRKFIDENPGKTINDQPFFRAALYCGNARVATLTREYNCKFRGQGYLNGRVKILHVHVDLKLDPSYARQAADVLNASSRPRVYVAGSAYEQQVVGRLVDLRRPHKVGSFPILPGSVTVRRLKQLRQIVQRKGIVGTLAKAFARKQTA